MKVIIVDDDRLVVQALQTILAADPGLTVPAAGADGEDAVRLYREYAPDVLLMDIRMQPMNGLDAAQEILAKDPSAKILFLTTFSDDEYIVRALRIGAKGYILKQDFESIIPALKAVSIGQSVFGGDVVERLPRLMKHKSADLKCWSIGEKEFEIIRLNAEGLNNKEIGERMFLSEGTVRNYLSIILDKLALRDRTQLAVFYYKHFG